MYIMKIIKMAISCSRRAGMREESEIFKEWVTKELQIESIDPLEYIALRDYIEFQRYLFRERIFELFHAKEICDFLEKILEKISH